MKYELSGVRNGVELYCPVAENEAEEHELEIRKERFLNLMADLILKHYHKIDLDSVDRDNV